MAEVKRGFRKVTAILPVKAYEALARIAEGQTRTPDQQAAYLLKRELETEMDTWERLNKEAAEDNQKVLDERLSGAWSDDNGALIEPEVPAEVE